MDFEKNVRELIEYPREANWFEFKENWYDPNGIGEYISSLSNVAALEGQAFGYLIWGVNNDTHELTGTKFDYTVDVKNEPLEHFLARQIVPDNNFSFHELTLEGKRIVVMVVPAASKVPTSFGGNRYLRIGSSKVNLNKYPERESNLFYIIRVGLPTICNTESEYQDLTFEKLFVYYASKGITLNRRTFKKNMGLLTEAGKYNLLAQLLSDNSYIPIRFAFVHNLWISGNAPMITVFSDRIEILSRGTIPPGQTMEGFFAGESVPVNQKLSDIFLQLHISERTGRGVPKITEVYGRETYEFRENSIVVSIPFTRVSTAKSTPVATPVSTPVSPPVDNLFEDSVQTKRILEFCTSPKGILEIADMLGYTQKKSVRKYLKPLVEQGRLAMTIPDRPNSSSQKYVTVR